MQSGGLRTKGIIKQSRENMPLITVVTVVYNGGKTLEETILSVINQTYKNVEYIIIDGSSTDNTLEIVKKYEDNIDYWISEPDNGIYYAMNKGIDLATGGWVNFMNSGDSFFQNNVIAEIYKDSIAADVIYGDYQIILNLGVLNEKPLPSANNGYVFPSHQSCFVKIKILRKYGFEIKYKIIADMVFLHRAHEQKCEFQYVPLIICRVEGDVGLSSRSKIRTRYEWALFNGDEKKISWLVKYFIFVVGYRVKSILKIILPNNLVRYIMLYHYKKYNQSFRESNTL